MSLGRTSTALGAFYRRLAARVGKAKAITATARKLAVLVYRVLSGDLIYNDPGATAYHHPSKGTCIMDGNHVPHHLGEFPADAVLLGRHVCVVEFDEALIELGRMTKVLDPL